MRVNVNRFVPYQFRNVNFHVINDGPNGEDYRDSKDSPVTIFKGGARSLGTRYHDVNHGVNNARFRRGLQILNSGNLFGLTSLDHGPVRVKDLVMRRSIFALYGFVFQDNLYRFRFFLSGLYHRFFQREDSVSSRLYGLFFRGTRGVALYQVGNRDGIVLTTGLKLSVNYCSFAPFMFFKCAIIVVFNGEALTMQMGLVSASSFVGLVCVVVEVHRQGGHSILRRCKGLPREDYGVIRCTIPIMFFTHGVVGPCAFKRMGTIASVVSLLIDFNYLVSEDGRGVEPMRVLMLYDHALDVNVQMFRGRHSCRQRAICNFLDSAMDVERRFQFRFRVPTIGKNYQFSRNIQMFLVHSPAIRIRFR